jgi:hypothetical protein
MVGAKGQSHPGWSLLEGVYWYRPMTCGGPSLLLERLDGRKLPREWAIHELRTRPQSTPHVANWGRLSGTHKDVIGRMSWKADRSGGLRSSEPPPGNMVHYLITARPALAA